MFIKFDTSPISEPVSNNINVNFPMILHIVLLPVDKPIV